jgi:hypothetical protein
MPVEHEIKHVLSLATAKELMEALASEHVRLEIDQFYVRFDNIFERILQDPAEPPTFRHVATTSTGGRVHAITTEISEKDYELAKLAAVEHLPTTAGTEGRFSTSTGNRFRRSVERSAYAPTEVKWTHTYKLMADGRLLEIEREVSAEDYTFARLGREESLSKIRYAIEAPDAHWDVDFLLTAPLDEDGEIYFALAEAETEEHAEFQPLPILDGHVEFRVPHERSSWFTNRKLADPVYASDVVKRFHASGADKPKG